MRDGAFLFKQERIGQYGKSFNIYKIRTMIETCDETATSITTANDERILPFGKWLRKTKLDVLFELVNVLKGEMSFVGPRPDVPGYADLLQGSDRKILELKPGITGLWQVSGRSTITDFEDVVKLDVQYIENWSFGLDLKILVQTVLVVLKHDGAQ